jgi:hypothetical protein
MYHVEAFEDNDQWLNPRLPILVTLITADGSEVSDIFAQTL